MNGRKIIEWAASPGGKSVLGLGAVILFVAVVFMTSKKSKPGIDKSDQIYVDKNREIRYQRELTNFNPGDQPHWEHRRNGGNEERGIGFRRNGSGGSRGETGQNGEQNKLKEKNAIASDTLDKMMKELNEQNGKAIRDGGAVENGEPISKQTLRDRIEQKKRELLQQRLKKKRGAGGLLGRTQGNGGRGLGQEQGGQNTGVLPLSLYTAPVTAASQVSGRFAPFGRLLKCELVVTIDSARINTPIIGLVTEDLWHNGVRIIPAGAEIHGSASRSSMRDRIEATGAWHIVWRTKDADNGKELQIKGTALTYTKHPNQQKWDIADGSAGIKGYVVDNTDWEDLIAIAAVFLSGVGEGMTSSEITTTGNTTRETFGGKTEDAIGKGLQRAMQLYAQRMLEAVNRDGAFVRVPAGSQFYLYIQETVDMNNAMIAGSMNKEAPKR